MASRCYSVRTSGTAAVPVTIVKSGRIVAANGGALLVSVDGSVTYASLTAANDVVYSNVIYMSATGITAGGLLNYPVSAGEKVFLSSSASSTLCLVVEE